MTLHHLSANDVHTLARRCVGANTSLTVVHDPQGVSIRLSRPSREGGRIYQNVRLSDLLNEATMGGMEFHLRSADLALEATWQRGRP